MIFLNSLNFPHTRTHTHTHTHTHTWLLFLWEIRNFKVKKALRKGLNKVNNNKDKKPLPTKVLGIGICVPYFGTGWWHVPPSWIWPSASQLSSLTEGYSRIESEVAQSRPTLSDAMDCCPPGFSVLGIFQARILRWVAISFSIIPSCYL